jgi:hypothetical protein
MKKEPKEITADEWIGAMFPSYTKQPPRGSFTQNYFMDKTGYKENTARMRLGAMVRKGELSVEKYLVNGKVTKYYTPIKKRK